MTDQVRVVYVTPQPTNALALAALILGLVAHGIALLSAALGPTPSPLNLVVFGWAPSLVPAVLAIIFGFIGMSTSNRFNVGRYAHATWGVILGFTPFVTWLFGVLIRALLFGAGADGIFGS
jgi:hypothetical protein